MDAKLITRAHWGDLEGMYFAGLVRLSLVDHRLGDAELEVLARMTNLVEVRRGRAGEDV